MSSEKNFNNQKLQFELFCEVRKWTVENFYKDGRKNNVFYGHCYDEYGMIRVYQIDELGKYFLLVGNKKKRPVSYVLENNDS